MEDYAMDPKKIESFGAEHLAEVDTVAGLGSGNPAVRIYGGAAHVMIVSRVPCPVEISTQMHRLVR